MTLVDIAVLLESEADKMPDRHYTVVDGVVTESTEPEQQDPEQASPTAPDNQVVSGAPGTTVFDLP